MIKLAKWMFITFSVLLILTACGGNDTTDNDNPDNEVEDPTDEEVVDNGEDENPGEAGSDDQEVPVDDNDEDDPSGETPNDGGILSLGDTGVMETTLGDYEVTPTAFRFEDEMTEDDPLQHPLSDTFIIMDVTIVNIGDEAMDAEEVISSAILEDLEGGGRSAYDDFVSIDSFEGEIAAGETVEGQLVFDLGHEDEYELSFGAAYTDSLSNEVRWQLFADQADEA